MPTWDQAERFINTTGLAAAIVVIVIFGFVLSVRAVWAFVKPLIEKWFEEQIKWFQSQTLLMTELVTFMQLTARNHKSDRKALISLGKAILASTDDGKKPSVEMYINDIIERFDGEED